MKKFKGRIEKAECLFATAFKKVEAIPENYARRS